MIPILVSLTVHLSDTIPGSAAEKTKNQALVDLRRILDETGRLEPSKEAALTILAFNLDADSSRSIYEKGSIEYIKEEPASCLFDVFWSAVFKDTDQDKNKNKEDTTYRYSYTSEFRLISVETGSVIGGFRAEGSGFGDSYSMAREMAWLDWMSGVELGIREMFRVQGKVKKTRGSWWNKKVDVDIGKAQGVEEGHTYSVWKTYKGGARRRVGLVEITETHPSWSRAKVLHGTYEIGKGDILYEETRPRLWQGVVRVMPGAGYAYDDQRLVARAKDIYFGFRPSAAYYTLAPEFGLEFTRHASAWGLENWVMGVGRADIIPEYLGLTCDLGMGFFWHHQPIKQGIILEGEPEGAETFGLGLRASAGLRLLFGEDFSVFGLVGWRAGIQTPWVYYLEGDSSGTSSESKGDWKRVPSEYLEDGDLKIFGPVITIGFAFKL
ncbi:MAG: hypothetical protein ABIN58_02710 [candidate division WOR-3 bacterium]